MLDRLKSALSGASATRSENLSFATEEPCEECGATPADDLVGVRWLCRACAPAARAEERNAAQTEGRTEDRT